MNSLLTNWLKDQKLPLVLGHRGAMAWAPQNTIPSFQLAQEQGAQGIELDVQLSKDGTLVVFHDAKVNAITDGKGWLKDLTFAQLRALDAGSSFSASYKGTKIPTLAEVFEAISSKMLVNIELKTDLSEDPLVPWVKAKIFGPQKISDSWIKKLKPSAERLAQKTYEEIRRLGVSERVLISSFDPFALVSFHELAPHIPIGFLHDQRMAFNTQVLMEGFDFQALHPHYTDISPIMIEKQRMKDRIIQAWTVNEPQEALKLATLGVDGLITNSPRDILQVLGR